MGEESEEALHIKWRRFALDLVTVGSQGEEGMQDFFLREEVEFDAHVLSPGTRLSSFLKGKSAYLFGCARS